MILLLTILLVIFVVGPAWTIPLLVVGLVLEGFEIYFLRRWAKRIDRKTETTTGSEAMLGQTGVVVAECRPDGTVRIGSELWEARCEAGAGPGAQVRVERVDELTLIVSPRI